MKKFLLFAAFLILFLASLKISAQNVAPFWSLSGNSNAAATSKLGTTNNIPLRLFTNNAERVRIDGTGKVGIGTTTPSGKLTVFGSGGAPAASWVTSGIPVFAGFGENLAGNADHILAMASNSPNARAVFLGRRARGTLPAPLKVQPNDYLLSLFGSGYDGGTFQAPATVDFFVDGPVSAGVVPARISLSTGSAFGNRTERLKVGSTGNIDINNAQLYVQQSNGYIGLGTATPGQKLTIENGNLRLQQTAIAPRYLEFIKTGATIDWRFEHSSTGRYFYVSFSDADFSTFRDWGYFDTATAPNGSGFVLNTKASSYGWDVFSDGKLKNNIETLRNASATLQQLKPSTYFFKTAEFPNMKLPSNRQYGLIAQEVEKVLPELVTTSEIQINHNGKERTPEVFKTVNYTGLIPLLIKASQEQDEHLKEQDSIIAQQQQQINQLIEIVKQMSGNLSPLDSKAVLGQNRPNPGIGNTSIDYFIPAETRHARLVLTDASGKMLRNIPVSGSGTLQMSVAGLPAGTYQYSLILDDRTVRTKKMAIAR